MFEAADARPHLPVSLVTGFLGSGKTTLLNRLLRDPAMANTAVIVNEFGDVALDQLFIERSDGEVVVMANGCLCCTVQGDLEAVIGTLYARRGAGDLPRFDRLLIETTGLADPAPILQLILGKPAIAGNFALDAVIATVDALHGGRQLDEHPEAVKQAALADRIVITKTDLAARDAADRLAARLGAINPLARQFRAPGERPAPAELFGVEHGEKWHGRVAVAAHEHLHEIETFSLAAGRPLPWHEFRRWLGRIAIREGERLLRVKGIVAIEGEESMIAIHGVHHVFHPPERLPHASAAGAQSRLVFITRGDVRAAIEQEWRAFLSRLE